jgi:hypothetical protein
MLLISCHRNDQKADIPAIGSMYANISYLDTLLRANQIDSIGKVNEYLAAKIEAYTSQAQSADDKEILDSLTRITSVVQDFLQFCITTQTNLELLEQDTKSLESQYRSGKIKTAAYVSARLEEEQILIDILNQLTSKNELALHYLKNQSMLVSRLNPLPVQGD